MAFECQDSFVINFTGRLLCTFVLATVGGGDPQGGAETQDDSQAIVATYGTTPINKNYIFTKGSADAGTYDAVIKYAVNGGAESETAPGGVTVSGAFSTAPDFTTAKGPREAQPGKYEGSIRIVNPENDDGTANPGGFQGNQLAVTIELGLDR